MWIISYMPDPALGTGGSVMIDTDMVSAFKEHIA